MDNMKKPAVLSQKPAGEGTVISSSFSIEGELEATEDTLIEGRTRGSIVVENHTVWVGRLGEVSGEIFAKRVVVEGRVDGQLRAKEKVELRETAHMKGTVVAPKVAIEEGCRFNGKVKTGPSALAGRSRGKSSSVTR